MKDYIIILLILFGVSTRISAQKSTSIEFIQKGVEYAQKENYDLAIFYLKLNIKENNIPDSIRVKGCFYLQHAYYLSGHSDFSWDLLKHYSLLYDSPDILPFHYDTVLCTSSSLHWHSIPPLSDKLSETGNGYVHKKFLHRPWLPVHCLSIPSAVS